MGINPKIGGKPPKWMVYFMENPIKIDDLRVPLFLETPISIIDINNYINHYIRNHTVSMLR